MKSQNRIFAVVVLLLALVLITPAQVALAVDVWTGDPDPFLCNLFLDCYWTIDVCIDRTTYEVGMFVDPNDPSNQFWLSEFEIEYGQDIGPCGSMLAKGKCKLIDIDSQVYIGVGNPFTASWVGDMNYIRFKEGGNLGYAYRMPGAPITYEDSVQTSQFLASDLLTGAALVAPGTYRAQCFGDNGTVGSGIPGIVVSK